MTELANRLKDLLASHDITQRELARGIGVSNVTIYRILIGQGDVMLNTVIAIADYFNVSIDWLIGRE
jgi:transcriptional regulator with XRE-family HTH domain